VYTGAETAAFLHYRTQVFRTNWRRPIPSKNSSPSPVGVFLSGMVASCKRAPKFQHGLGCNDAGSGSMNPKSNNHLEISVRLHPLDHKRPIFVKGNLPSKSPPVAFSWIPSASRTHSRHFRIKRESRNFAPRHELKISRIDKMDSRLPLALLPWSIMRRSVHARACLRTSKFDTL